MRIVLDASAAVEAVMDEDSKVHRILQFASAILAPEHFIVEVTSGLWKHVTLAGLPLDDAIERLQVATEMVFTFREVPELAEEVLREAAERRHSVYDVYYAVLARREKAAVLTFDKRLKQLCAEMRIPLADA